MVDEISGGAKVRELALNSAKMMIQFETRARGNLTPLAQASGGSSHQ
jgi:hypothetical protein